MEKTLISDENRERAELWLHNADSYDVIAMSQAYPDLGISDTFDALIERIATGLARDYEDEQ